MIYDSPHTHTSTFLTTTPRTTHDLTSHQFHLIFFYGLNLLVKRMLRPVSQSKCYLSFRAVCPLLSVLLLVPFAGRRATVCTLYANALRLRSPTISTYLRTCN
ncbi:hypothetical protein C8R44DRAFT_118634 [Mycena epipterygia]|nr:hypothetical protein C8R44DRAFT_118634 [Mycena epipterygia]